jgi:hypothetical protein
LSSNYGILKVSKKDNKNKDLVLPSLTVNGAVTLASDINTTRDQTYNGPVTLGAGYRQLVDGTWTITPMLLTTVKGNITFADTLAAGNLSYANQQALTIDVGTGTVTFGGKVGLDYVTESYTYSRYIREIDFVPNIYQLLVKAHVVADKDDPTSRDTYGKIVIQDNITTFDKQTYDGPVIIGRKDSINKTIILLSEDPTIIFKNTVDDSEADQHALEVRAILVNGNESPIITFEGKVGENVPLASLKVETGTQKDKDNNFSDALYSTIEPEKYYGVLTIDKVTTYGDQTYAAFGKENTLDFTLPTYKVAPGATFNTATGKVSWLYPKTSNEEAPKKCEGCFVPPTSPSESQSNFTNTDLESILREQNDRTGFGGQENTPYSGSGTVNVLFCGAQDNFVEQAKQECDDI